MRIGRQIHRTNPHRGAVATRLVGQVAGTRLLCVRAGYNTTVATWVRPTSCVVNRRACCDVRGWFCCVFRRTEPWCREVSLPVMIWCVGPASDPAMRPPARSVVHPARQQHAAPVRVATAAAPAVSPRRTTRRSLDAGRVCLHHHHLWHSRRSQTPAKTPALVALPLVSSRRQCHHTCRGNA